MINIFNPEKVILGGELADTAFNANLAGCCFIARDRTLEILR